MIMAIRPLTLAIFLAFAANSATAATLNEALDAYRNNHVAEAERQLGEIAAAPASTSTERATALRELGRIDWLIRGETDAIAAAIVESSGDDRCVTATLALRIYREAGTPGRALADAETASAQCTPAHGDAMHVELARAHLALAVSGAIAEQAAHLTKAAAELDTVDAAARGAPNVAGPRLALAIAQRDPEASLSAWKNYYWLTETDAPQGMATYAGRVGAIFAAGMAANARDEDIIALVDMLVRAGFVDEARSLASQTGLAAREADAPAWRRLAAYFRFDEAVREIVLRCNREMAEGNPAPSFDAEIRAAMAQLMESAGLSGDPREAMADAYGLYGSLGETSGYPSLHGGHIAQDQRLSIDQYGRHGDLRFIVIDNMISNGFESWLWDGWAEAGGWSGDGVIVQVRSAYTAGPLVSLRRTRPGPIRDAYLQRIVRDADDERVALGNDGVAPLPATGARLEMQALDQIAARFEHDDEGFIAEIWRATNQYSIELHEGRHALDKASGHFTDIQLEFRAKLSQIALADYPRLGLANVVSTTLGDNAHGAANRLILEGYRAWMRQHRRQIAHFDRTAPTLSQLDKLSDAQIRAIARSLDPWAAETR